MARSRMIRPEFWDDEKLSKISRDARLTFIGTWNHSDDYGVVKGSHRWLKNKIFPYDNIQDKLFDVWMDNLVKMDVLIPFTNSGERYYFIKNFLKHQKVNRPSKQRNPEPPQQILEDSLNNHGELIDETETETETETYPEESLEYELSKLLFDHILINNPKFKKPNFQGWCSHLEKAVRIDKRSFEDLRKVISWCQKDDFWQTNILSTAKLRKQFDQLWGKMNKETKPKRIPKETDDDYAAWRRQQSKDSVF